VQEELISIKKDPGEDVKIREGRGGEEGIPPKRIEK